MINENKIYNAALYCRLSKDDEQAGESVSIGIQKMILEKFCKEQDFRVFDVHVDDGFSGLNFERPEFQRMLKGIEEGKINLVITKDLSRLGRDYIQTGYYTEVYFQQKHVRYIAVNDGIDTNREDNVLTRDYLLVHRHHMAIKLTLWIRIIWLWMKKFLMW